MSYFDRLMGESNGVKIRQPRFKKSTWTATKAAYASLIPQEERDGGFLPATFQVPPPPPPRALLPLTLSYLFISSATKNRAFFSKCKTGIQHLGPPMNEGDCAGNLYDRVGAA